jgi:hypothetical protein
MNFFRELIGLGKKQSNMPSIEDRSHPSQALGGMTSMKAVVFLHMGREVLNCLVLDDIVQFSACCVFCDQLFLVNEAVKALLHQHARLQPLLPLFSLTFTNECTLGVLRKLVFRIFRENLTTRERTVSLTSKVSGFASSFLQANPDVCPAVWKEEMLLDGMVKAGEDCIVLIVRSSSIAEQEALPATDPVLEKATVDEYNDFQPHSRNIKRSINNVRCGNSHSFCSVDELEEQTCTVLRGLGSLSDLELWSLDAMSVRIARSRSPFLSREGSPRRTVSSPMRVSPRRESLLSPIDIGGENSDEEMLGNMRFSDSNITLVKQ